MLSRLVRVFLSTVGLRFFSGGKKGSFGVLIRWGINSPRVILSFKETHTEQEYSYGREERMHT